MKLINHDTLVAVSAYAGDLHQIQSNLPFYTHHGCPVVLLSPTDAPITWTGNPRVECRTAGLKGWIGAHTLERQRKFLEILLEYPKNFFLLNDADSICLTPAIPQYLYEYGDTIWSNEVVDTNPGPSMLPKIALQPPYFFTRKCIEGMLAAAKNPPVSYTCAGPSTGTDGSRMPIPTDCIDHWMLQIACGSGYPHRNFSDGASFETSSKLGLETMATLVRDHGRVMIHQVKTRLVLRRLYSERLQYQRTHRK